MHERAIEEHGVIGDLHTVALVATDGCIDFLCFPHFDSPSVFAALLDGERGGHFSLAPQIGVEHHRQFYLPDTNVLITRFLSDEGVAELSDLMPVETTGNTHDLVRRIKTVRGNVHYRMRCAPRFDYGRAGHRVERDRRGIVFVSEGDDRTALRLRSSLPVEVHDGDAVAEFTLAAGEHAWFVLEQAGPDGPADAPHYVVDAFKDTVNFWRRWIGRSTYRGRWRELVQRSALALKLLTSERHGSTVAAPTFGLPEEIGGERNWDYRFTWIRDSSFMIYALLRLGLYDEARAYFGWIGRLCEQCRPDGDGPLQIMYALDGSEHLPESELDHLSGYRGSRPVRIGNAAHEQLQLDIYGALLDSIYLYDKYGEPIHHGLWQHLVPIVDWVCRSWEQADAGIWEIRSGRQEFLFSRVMCWVAIDRAVRLARRRSLPAPLHAWAEQRDRIYQDVFRNFWNPGKRAFIQYKGGDSLDASALMMPLVRLISPTDPLWLSTMRAIEDELVDDSFVFRYRSEHGLEDGLSGKEGTFSMCSFWFAECLSRSGDLEKARLYFEKLTGHANHLGLFAEELGLCGEHLGNFPQGFTHLALISTAYDLDRRLTAREG